VAELPEPGRGDPRRASRPLLAARVGAHHPDWHLPLGSRGDVHARKAPERSPSVAPEHLDDSFPSGLSTPSAGSLPYRIPGMVSTREVGRGGTRPPAPGPRGAAPSSTPERTQGYTVNVARTGGRGATLRPLLALYSSYVLPVVCWSGMCGLNSPETGLLNPRKHASTQPQIEASWIAIGTFLRN
jgi:hypothetical protein